MNVDKDILFELMVAASCGKLKFVMGCCKYSRGNYELHDFALDDCCLNQ